MTLNELKTALEAATGYPWAEEGWNAPPDADAYGAVSVEGADGALWANGYEEDQAARVSVDLWARKGPGEAFSITQSAIRSLGIPWEFADGIHDTGLRVMHYEWLVQLLEVY